MPATGESERRRSGGRRFAPSTLIGAGLVFVGIVSVTPPAEGRLLSLTGQVDIDYRLTLIDVEGKERTDWTLRETVRAGTGGELFREAIGQYRLNFNFVNEDREISVKTNQQIIDFFAGVDLLPHRAPLGLSVQRNTQEVEVGAESGETTVTTYNLTWDFPRVWKLPQLHLNLFQSIFETSTGATQRVSGGSVSASDAYPYRYIVKNTELRWSISFSAVEQFSGGSTGLSAAARVDADSQWTSAVKTNIRVGYSTSMSRQTPDVPGGIATATTAGVTLFYRPSLRLNSSAGYDYTRDLDGRHIARAEAFYRPTPQYDIIGTLQGSMWGLDGETGIMSVFGSGIVMYRPRLNLTTSFTSTLGATQVTGTGEVRSLFQNYGVSANYFKIFELARMNTGAGLSYGNTMMTGDNTNNVNSNWALLVSNTKTQYVTVTGSYTGFFTGQSEGDQTELWTNSVRGDVSSSYFRELLLRGDSLSLHFGVGDLFFNSNTDNYQIVDIGVDAHYGWRTVGVGTGYVTHMATRAFEDYNLYFWEIQWTPPGVYGLSSFLRARWEEQIYAGGVGVDRQIALADANIGYQIGLIQFSLQYQFMYQEFGITTLSHNLFARLTRRFSL